MNKTLIIVFVKNIELGKVKTRLAKVIGNYGAAEVYSELLDHTQVITSNIDIDKHIYFSNTIEDNQWPNAAKSIQQGKDLGERMLNAFKDGFLRGYEKIVLIGSDLPDLKEVHIIKAIDALSNNDLVFGPAEDGGYYLIGMRNLIAEVFENKPWSQSNLLEVTLQELHRLSYSYKTLESLNDIDTYEDLIVSDFFKSNHKLQEKIQQLND